MNSMENLRFGKEGYFHVSVFYTGYFIKEIENIFSRVAIRHSNTHGSFGEFEIAWKYSPYGFVFPLQILVLPSIDTENVFYFLNITLKPLYNAEAVR